MKRTVILSMVLFLITVAILIYYAIYADNGHFLTGGNLIIDLLMLSLVVIAGILTGVVYLFNSRVRTSGGNVQAV